METLNAVGLSPISFLAKRRESRRSLSIPTISQFKKNQNISSFSVSRSLQGGLAILSSVLNSGFAKALTYEEALQQSVNSDSSSIPDIDVGGLLDNVVTFASDNPLIVGGGVAVVAVPLLVSQLLGKPKPWGVETAKNAYAKLGGDANALLLDIRASSDIKQGGNPDIRALKKKPIAIVYKGDDKSGFLNKLSLKIKEPENTTLFVLDKFDGNSELVAELATINGFKAAYAIKDGAEGPRGWKNSGLPWILPKKALSFDLSNLTDSFGEVSAVPLVLGVAVAVGLGLLTYTEAETILQVLGTTALVQFVSKKLLYEEDRKLTLKQIDEVLNTQVAPSELVGDIQQIGKALLPPIVISKTLPVPVEAKPPAPSDSESTSPPIAEAAPEVNSVPKAEIVEESLAVPPWPLSPYPNYPDFKPPSSPMPSQP